jgi:hypothetical protein
MFSGQLIKWKLSKNVIKLSVWPSTNFKHISGGLEKNQWGTLGDNCGYEGSNWSRCQTF